MSSCGLNSDDDKDIADLPDEVFQVPEAHAAPSPAFVLPPPPPPRLPAVAPRQQPVKRPLEANTVRAPLEPDKRPRTDPAELANPAQEFGDPDDEIEAPVAIELDDMQKEAERRILAGKSTFITGPAGTGKSLLLRSVIRKIQERGDLIFVTAPTGIAASNVKGTTLHFFAGIGGDAQPPYDCRNQEARSRIMFARVLVVDEISMVNQHFLDALNCLCRMVRGRLNEDFGGIQLIVCGDFFQLPPVDDGGKQDALRNNGKSASKHFFFSKQCTPELIKMYQENLTPLDHGKRYAFHARCWDRMFGDQFVWLRLIHRQQSDNPLCKVLSEVRIGKPSQETMKLLHRRRIQFHCNFSKLGNPQLPEGYTVLFPKNDSARSYNDRKFKEITTDRGLFYKSFDYACNDKLKPMINSLCQYLIECWLKVGSRVMLKHNLACNSTVSLVNGSCGEVIGFAERFVVGEGGVCRPVEGCVLPHFVRPEFLSDKPYLASYKVPLDPVPDAPESVNRVCLKEGVRMQSFCPLEEFEKLRWEATHLPDKNAPPARWAMPSVTKLAILINFGFKVLPVVQFENGEVVVVQPHLWAVKESARAAARAARKRGEAGGPSPNAPAKIIVSRLQIPLIPAFATSIHASQGLTLPKLAADVGKHIFTNGQAYVALSRATTIENLLLYDVDQRKLEMVDEEVLEFYNKLELHEQGAREEEEGDE